MVSTMHEESLPPDFLSSVLDSLDVEIAVISESGAIVYVNEAWNQFGAGNDAENVDWCQMNYLDVCSKASKTDQSAKAIYQGLSSVLSGQHPTYWCEYPCHTKTEKRWFVMRVSRLPKLLRKLFVVTHSNSTTLNLAQEKLDHLKTELAATMEKFKESLSDERSSTHQASLAATYHYLFNAINEFQLIFLELETIGHVNPATIREIKRSMEKTVKDMTEFGELKNPTQETIQQFIKDHL